MSQSLHSVSTSCVSRRNMLWAMALMMVSMAAFSLMNVFIRMGAEQVHTTQIVFLRNLFSVLMFLPWVIRGGRSFLQTTKPVGHFWRGTIGVCGMQLWFYCVSILPLNEATALSFTAPIFTTIFAIVFLGEKAGLRRWSAIVIGFVGAMVIIRPNPQAMDWNLLLVPASTSLWAIAALLVKNLTKTEPPNRIVFYMALVMTFWALPMALPFWQTPSWQVIGLCLIVAVCSTIAHLTMVSAYARVEISSLAPFDFFRLVFTAIFAYIAFGEVADEWTWIGGGVIVASAAYIAYREAKLKHSLHKEELLEP